MHPYALHWLCPEIINPAAVVIDADKGYPSYTTLLVAFSRAEALRGLHRNLAEPGLPRCCFTTLLISLC